MTEDSPLRRRPGRPRIERPHPVDLHVGQRVRLRRTLLGMSQEALGRALGLTFQQVQKYERGANRISSSRLYSLSQILDVPVSFFFDDLPKEYAGPTQNQHGFALSEMDREVLEFIKAYLKMPEAMRAQFRNMVKSIADIGDHTTS